MQEQSKFGETPDKRSGDSDMDGIIIHVNNFIRQQEIPTPVGAAIAFHDCLVEAELKPSEDDEIFYNFDDQYKVKFQENGRPQVAVFWAPWMGGVSWRIEEDK